MTDLPYRTKVNRPHLRAFRVKVQQTDLLIQAQRDLTTLATTAVYEARRGLEQYIASHPEFVDALVPWPEDPLAPPLVQEMIQAGQQAAVGPMAAVAGAIAQRVGRTLLGRSGEVIVENGGDIFLHLQAPATVALYAGTSPLSLKIGLVIHPEMTPLGVCTSSGTIGHSLSFGRADAACVLADDAAVADAAATALGNRVRREEDLAAALAWVAGLPDIRGAVIIYRDKLGAWGQIELQPVE